MPRLSEMYWRLRWLRMDGLHYGNRWEDRYADVMRKHAIGRVWPKDVRYVLDAGCGDGRFGLWLGKKHKVTVMGADVQPWGAERRLPLFQLGDMEMLHKLKWPVKPDLVLMVTSLPFVRDWVKAFDNACRAAPRILLIDNLQDPVPSWQRGANYKHHLTFAQVAKEAEAMSFRVAKHVGATFLDRRLFVHIPKKMYPLAMMASLTMDPLLVRFMPASRWRYQAVLFERRGYGLER